MGKRIWKDGVCSAQTLKLRLEVNQLERFGMLKDPCDRLLIKKNTRLMYTQQKFNLFAKRMKGGCANWRYSDTPDSLVVCRFSRLVVSLLDDSVTVINIYATISTIIGHYKLDPNRVLDCLLDICELRIERYAVYRSVFRSSALPTSSSSWA